MSFRSGLLLAFPLLTLLPFAACQATGRSFDDNADASLHTDPVSSGLDSGRGTTASEPTTEPTAPADATTPTVPVPEPAGSEPEPTASEPEPLVADASVLDASVEPESLPEPSPVPDDVDSGPPVCPPSDECRDFSVDAVSGCVETGTCPTALGCEFVWTAVARDGEACECSDQDCGLVLAEPCGGDDACASGACVPTATNQSVCCEQSCDDDEVCSHDGASCEPAPICVPGDVRCSASAAYQECIAGQWSTAQECGALGCSTALVGCLRAAGESCTATAECGEGVCRTSSAGGSICCTASCDSACRRCAPTGTSCQALTDDDACGSIQCPADTTCRDYGAAVTSNRCVAGACGTPAELCDFVPIAAGQPCDANNLCSSSGDCSIPKKTLGTSCGEGAECLSGNCADGVCCDSACGSVCETCNASGQCVATADDTQCSNVTCNPDTQCRNYAASITSNRCKARGSCKTAVDCSYTDAPAGTPCGVSEQCDGAGTCPPRIVPCGATSCPVNPGVCCWYSALQQASCEAGDTCPNMGSATGRNVLCSSSLQCPTGEICCNYSNPGGSGVDCRASCDPASQGVSNAPVCQQGNLAAAPCPTGLTCGSQTSAAVPPGYDRCEY